MIFAVRTLVTAASLFVADYLLGGIHFEAPGYTGDPQTNYLIALTLAAIVLGVLNAFVRPVMQILAIPLIVLTLGFFILVINGMMLLATSVLSGVLGLGFHVTGFWAAFLGALVVSVVSLALSMMVKD